MFESIITKSTDIKPQLSGPQTAPPLTCVRTLSTVRCDFRDDEITPCVLRALLRDRLRKTQKCGIQLQGFRVRLSTAHNREGYCAGRKIQSSAVTHPSYLNP